MKLDETIENLQRIQEALRAEGRNTDNVKVWLDSGTSEEPVLHPVLDVVMDEEGEPTIIANRRSQHGKPNQ
jgi:hypothetical protein